MNAIRRFVIFNYFIKPLCHGLLSDHSLTLFAAEAHKRGIKTWGKKGWAVYCKIIHDKLSYLATQFKP